MTASSRTARALRLSEERFRLVTMATRDGVYDWDLKAQAVWRNDAFQTLFSPDEPIEGTHEWWRQRVHRDDYPRIQKSLEDTFRNHAQIWSGEYSFRKADGSYAMVVDRCYIRYDESRQPVRVIGVMSDVTERRQTERNLHHSETELRRRNADIHELAGKLMTAQEEERRRISRDLHDDLNQKMAALIMRLTTIMKRVPAADGRLRTDLDNLLSSVFEVTADIRRISHELHPAILDHIGLAGALKAYVAELSRLEKIEIDLKLPESIEVAHDIAVGLYRLAQEALRNIVKHSGASQAAVSLSRDDRAIYLSVSDSGVGFDLAAARSKGGLGLVSMEERVRLMQGNLNILTSPGSGARLTVIIPLRRSNDV